MPLFPDAVFYGRSPRCISCVIPVMEILDNWGRGSQINQFLLSLFLHTWVISATSLHSHACTRGRGGDTYAHASMCSCTRSRMHIEGQIPAWGRDVGGGNRGASKAAGGESDCRRKLREVFRLCRRLTSPPPLTFTV